MERNIFGIKEDKKMKKKRAIRKKKDPDITALIEFLQKEIESLYPDTAKFDYRNNNTAGVRVRIKLQEIAYKIKSVRYEILLRKKKREGNRAKAKKKK